VFRSVTMMIELDLRSATMVGSLSVSWLEPEKDEVDGGRTAPCGATAWPGRTAWVPPPVGTPLSSVPIRYIALSVRAMSTAFVWRRWEM